MSLMDSIVTEDLLRATTWTLVHFLWQGTIIAVALAIVTRMFRFSAAARYAGGIVTMAVMLAAPILTMALITPAAPRQTTVAAATSSTPRVPAVELPSVQSNFTQSIVAESAEVTTGLYWFTLVPAFWMIGVLIFALRLAGGWMLTRRLALDGVSPVQAHIDTLVRNVATRLRLRRVVRVVESSRVAVPVMFGWIRPIILLPAATIAGLTQAQLEALIAHELIHVRRHDFIVNLLQMVAETMLFFHPAIWWVSRYIRREREHCCDDAVVEVCDRVEYVSALTHLANAGQMHMALAASDGSLLNRVRRLLAAPEHAAPGWIPILVVLMVAGGIAPLALMTTDGVAASARVALSADAASQAPTPVVPANPPVTKTASTSSPEVDDSAAEIAAMRAEFTRLQASRADRAGLAAAEVDTQGAGSEAGAVLSSLRNQLSEAEQRLQTMRREREDLEAQRASAQLGATITAMRDELEAALANQKHVQTRVEIGAADAAALAEAQVRTAALKRQLQSAEAELVFQTRSATLSQAQVEREREYQVLDQRYRELLAEQNAARQAAMDRVAIEEARQRDLAGELVGKGSNEPIAVGDMLVIAIDGEPNLPSDYRVPAAGTIRLPLLDTFAVIGRTATEVEADIRRALAGRGLKEATVVRVIVRRPAVATR